MKNKFKVSFLALSLFIVLLVSSCSKNTEEQQVYQTTNQSEIVNKIITAIVEIIGPMELSAKQDKAIEKEATTNKLKKAIPKAQ